MNSRTNPDKSGGKVFRWAFAPLFLFVCLVALPPAFAISAASDYGRGLRVDWPVWFFAASIGILAAVVLILALQRLFPIVVTSSGIHGQSVLGFSRFLAWADIEDRGRIPVVLISWATLVSRTTGKKLSLPLFLSRPEEFRNEIQKYAPDCPLAKVRHSPFAEEKQLRLFAALASLALILGSLAAYCITLPHIRTLQLERAISDVVDQMKGKPPSPETAEAYVRRLRALDAGSAPIGIRDALHDYIAAVEQSIAARKSGQNPAVFDARISEQFQKLKIAFSRHK